MPPSIVPDSVQTLEMDEVNGVVRSLKRTARITGLTSTTYAALIEAYQLVDLPTPGSSLEQLLGPIEPLLGVYLPLSMLVLDKRTFRLVDKDAKTVDVLMHYTHFMDGNNQVIGKPTTGIGPNGWVINQAAVVYGKNRASVQQNKSNFYLTSIRAQAFNGQRSYIAGEVVDFSGFFWVAINDINWIGPVPIPNPPGGPGVLVGDVWGLLTEQQIITSSITTGTLPLGVQILPTPVRRQIQVGHTFDRNDQSVPGQTIFQTGEISIMHPNDNFKLTGQVFIRNPRVIKNALLGAINSITWMDGAPYEWMCMEVGWEPIFAEYQYAFTMEFQHNPDTWLPTAIFNDARTGRPPRALVPNFGFREIHRQKEVNFDQYMGVTFGASVALGA